VVSLYRAPAWRLRSSMRLSRVEVVLLAVATGGGAALLPRSVRDRYAVPGVRPIELLGVGLTLEPAVVTVRTWSP
jgi:DNA-binding transcriptional LysR family regulator